MKKHLLLFLCSIMVFAAVAQKSKNVSLPKTNEEVAIGSKSRWSAIVTDPSAVRNKWLGEKEQPHTIQKEYVDSFGGKWGVHCFLQPYFQMLDTTLVIRDSLTLEEVFWEGYCCDIANKMPDTKCYSQIRQSIRAALRSDDTKQYAKQIFDCSSFAQMKIDTGNQYAGVEII